VGIAEVLAVVVSGREGFWLRLAMITATDFNWCTSSYGSQRSM